ncbi:MAG: DUF3153 domain-containing protein [Cyanobacteria bacterium]|nr:DUF3153 domain-containing protein [Cyanobacteriota bacterium]
MNDPNNKPVEDQLTPSLAAAHQAIERGDYGRVVRLLEPLAEEHPALTAAGAELRLLLATALMGQGQSEAASAWCRSLRACQDPDLRARGKALQMVLEAPALQRPRDWSITLPDLPVSGSLESLGATTRNLRRSRKADPPPPPPVGPTRAPLGFAALVVVALSLFLLASPWQRRLGASLEREGFRSREASGATLLQSPVLPLDQARAALAASVQAASEAGGESVPAPRLEVRERNWLVGVDQRVWLDLDLRELPPLPAVDLSIGLESVRAAAVRHAEPETVQAAIGSRLIWPLRLGSLNRLELRCWRWSPLGLGGCAIALLLPLVLGLQRLRRQLGFGLPELPA